jgi:hypothetical protein
MVEFKTSQIGVQARQAGQVSLAPARNLARAASSMKMAADTFSQFYEQEAQIENERLLATAQSDWTQTYNARQADAGSGFAKSMVSDYDTYITELLTDSPERGRDELKLSLDKYRMNLETKSLQREAVVRANAKAAAIAQANNLKANALIGDPSLLDDYLEGAGPKESSLFVRSALSGQMSDNPQAVNDVVMEGKWDAVLTPEQKLSFMKLSQSGIDRIAKEEETALKANQKLYLDGLSEELDYVTANGALPVDSQYTNENIDMWFPNKEEAAELKRVRDQSVMHAENKNSVATAMPAELEYEITKLQAAVAEPDHTQEDVNALNSYVVAAQQRNQQITSDAAGHVQNNVDFIQTQFDFYSQMDGADKVVAAENYAASIDAQYNIMGVAPELRNLLPKNAAKQMVAQFNNMGVDIAAQSLKKFKDSWGNQGPRIIAELENAGLAPAYGQGMRYSDDPGLAARVVATANLSENDLKENLIKTDVTDAMQEYNEAIADYQSAYVAGDPTGQALNTFNGISETTRKLIFQDIARGMDSASAVEKNVKEMLPEEAINEENAQLIVPVGVNANVFRGVLDQAMTEDLLRSAKIQPLDDPRLPEFADIETNITHLEKQGLWMNNSTGDGAVLHYNINGYYLPVTVEGGGFYEMKFAGTPEAGPSALEAFAGIWPALTGGNE